MSQRMNVNGASAAPAASLAPIHQRLRLAPSAFLLGALLVWFSIPTFESLHPFWTSEHYSHGYLALILTAFLFVMEFRRAPLEPLTPNWLAVACLIGFVLVIVAGQGATSVTVSQLALPALWMAGIWSLAGTRNARRFAPSLAYLYVAIPVWTILVGLLQTVTISVVSAWIRAAHLPAFIDGDFFHVPSGTFEVQEGCGGLRQALMALALAFFVGLLRHRSLASTVFLTTLGLALALVGNWIRVFSTIVVGLSPGSDLLLIVRDHHYLFGWTVFVVVMIPFFVADRLLERWDSDPPVPASSPAHAVVLGGDRIGYAICAVLAVGILLNYRIDPGDKPTQGGDVRLPTVSGWTRVGDWQDASRPSFVGASATAAGWYTDGESRIGVFGASYTVQQQGREVVYSKNQPEGESSSVVGNDFVNVPTDSGATIPFQELRTADADSQQRLVWVGLRAAGTLASGPVSAKALQLFGALSGRRDAQAFVLTAVCGADCVTARSSLSRYAKVAAAQFYEDAEPR